MYFEAVIKKALALTIPLPTGGCLCGRHSFAEGTYFFLDEKVSKKSTAAFLNDPLRGRSLNRANLSLCDFEQRALCLYEAAHFLCGSPFRNAKPVFVRNKSKVLNPGVDYPRTWLC